MGTSRTRSRRMGLSWARRHTATALRSACSSCLLDEDPRSARGPGERLLVLVVLIAVMPMLAFGTARGASKTGSPARAVVRNIERQLRRAEHVQVTLLDGTTREVKAARATDDGLLYVVADSSDAGDTPGARLKPWSDVRTLAVLEPWRDPGQSVGNTSKMVVAGTVVGLAVGGILQLLYADQVADSPGPGLIVGLGALGAAVGAIGGTATEAVRLGERPQWRVIYSSMPFDGSPAAAAPDSAEVPTKQHSVYPTPAPPAPPIVVERPTAAVRDLVPMADERTRLAWTLAPSSRARVHVGAGKPFELANTWLAEDGVHGSPATSTADDSLVVRWGEIRRLDARETNRASAAVRGAGAGLLAGMAVTALVQWMGAGDFGRNDDEMRGLPGTMITLGAPVGLGVGLTAGLARGWNGSWKRVWPARVATLSTAPSAR